MTIIITRNGLWLDNRYGWGVIPHLFPSWQAGDAIELMLGTPQPATGYAVVKPGVVDLDTVEVVKI